MEQATRFAIDAIASNPHNSTQRHMPEPHQPQQHHIQIAGRRAFYREAGSGPPVVILASMLVLARSYLPTIASLSARYRVICLEPPGCGHASKLEQPWSFEEYADFLLSFIDALQLDRPHIIGHSNSGPVAILLAAEHPHRISSITLTDSIGADHTFSLLRVMVGRAIDAILELKLTLRGLPHIFYNVFAHPMNFWSQVGLSAKTNILPAARRVTTPTLIACGRRDNTMPLRCAGLFRQAIAGSTEYTSPTGSHDWLITNPAEFEAAFTRFLSDV
jgi:pimeloyl-ACP methyl ester carboxylesterase